MVCAMQPAMIHVFLMKWALQHAKQAKYRFGGVSRLQQLACQGVHTIGMLVTLRSCFDALDRAVLHVLDGLSMPQLAQQFSIIKWRKTSSGSPQEPCPQALVAIVIEVHPCLLSRSAPISIVTSALFVKYRQYDFPAHGIGSSGAACIASLNSQGQTSSPTGVLQQAVPLEMRARLRAQVARRGQPRTSRHVLQHHVTDLHAMHRMASRGWRQRRSGACISVNVWYPAADGAA